MSEGYLCTAFAEIKAMYSADILGVPLEGSDSEGEEDDVFSADRGDGAMQDEEREIAAT